MNFFVWNVAEENSAVRRFGRALGEAKTVGYFPHRRAFGDYPIDGLQTDISPTNLQWSPLITHPVDLQADETLWRFRIKEVGGWNSV